MNEKTSPPKGEQEKGILNTMREDSSGKIIFENNKLCCQFLNNYVDLPYFGDIRPENMEDVSSEFVPLFAQERHADRVKEIKIPNEKMSFFLVSLIEHKTKVEYNIHMQIFRYMVYIWERYEKQEEHGDGISLAMLFNKLQGKKDVEAFRKIPADKVDHILKDLPDEQIDILAKVLRAFLVQENVPEEETEELVGKVKVKKMAQLFENMEKMDIQAERRKTAEANRKAVEANRKMDEMKEKMKEKGIRECVEICRELNATFDYVVEKLRNAYSLSDEKAREKIKLYW